MLDLITEHLATWTSAKIPQTNGGRGRGRGSNGQIPHGIKKLRELILELAVRGKLVSQDPNDEPAGVLLEKIAKEKARLIKEGKIKKQKTLPKIGEEEKPFDLPDGWEWVRFGTLVNSILSGGTPSKRNPDYWNGGIPWASVKDLGDSKYLETTQDHITLKGLRAGSTLAEIDDVIICTRMGLGKIAIAKAKIAINQDLKAIKLTSQLDVDFFLNFFATLNIKGTGTTVAGIRQEQLLSYVICFPPLAEQNRIVAKVDELMALCDKLEQQQTDSNDTHQTLVQTLLATLTTVADPAEFALSWQRIVSHFDTLFTTEESIDQLKQTILQLAVMGKLVPQDPNDEPASTLLGKITKEKDRLVKEGKIKKQKKLAKISEDEKLFALPDGWEWIKFGLLAEFINGDRSKNYPNRSEYVEHGVAWINTGHIEPNGFLTTKDMNFISQEKFESLRSGKIEKGDLVYCLRGATFGKTAFVEPYEEGAIASSLMIIRPHIKKLNHYVFKYLVSPFGKAQLFRFDNGSAQPNLSANSVLQYAFPLPPFAEQHRIVAKVDELLALCDTLKERLHDAQITQVQLADAIVEQAVSRETSAGSEETVVAGKPQTTLRVIPYPQTTASGPDPLPQVAEPAPTYSHRQNTSNLNSIPQQILDAMKPGRSYSRADLAGPLNLTTGRWNQAIRQLKDQGLVIQQGEKRGARYRLATK